MSDCLSGDVSGSDFGLHGLRHFVVMKHRGYSVVVWTTVTGDQT